MRPRPKPQGLKRHLDGWQAGLVVLVIAGGAILLAVPRGVAPDHVPMPNIDWAALRATVKKDDRLAVEAQTRTLHHDVRAAGKAYRDYNVTVASNDTLGFPNARTALITRAREAMDHGPEPLLMLRAYHTQVFVNEIRRWAETGEVTEELTMISGDFLHAVRRNEWCRESASGDRVLAVSDDVLRVIFKRRWNDLLGMVKVQEMALTLEEDRLRHGFLIRHPFRRRSDLQQGAPVSRATIEKRRLKSIDRLAAIDADYPMLLARGVVHYQSGSYARSASAFRAFLVAKPNPHHALRAQNFLKAALDKTSETGGI